MKQRMQWKPGSAAAMAINNSLISSIQKWIRHPSLVRQEA